MTECKPPFTATEHVVSYYKSGHPMPTNRPIFIILLTLCATVLVLRASDAYSQQVTVNRFELIAFGMYRAETAQQRTEGGSATGKMNITSKVALFMPTDTVPGSLGVKFGLQYKILGQPQGSPVRIEVVIEHPPIRKPGSAEAHTVTRFEISPQIGETTYTGWSFDDPWTVVPGKWTWKLLFDGRTYLQKTFVVVK